MLTLKHRIKLDYTSSHTVTPFVVRFEEDHWVAVGEVFMPIHLMPVSSETRSQCHCLRQVEIPERAVVRGFLIGFRLLIQICSLLKLLPCARPTHDGQHIFILLHNWHVLLQEILCFSWGHQLHQAVDEGPFVQPIPERHGKKKKTTFLMCCSAWARIRITYLEICGSVKGEHSSWLSSTLSFRQICHWVTLWITATLLESLVSPSLLLISATVNTKTNIHQSSSNWLAAYFLKRKILSCSHLPLGPATLRSSVPGAALSAADHLERAVHSATRSRWRPLGGAAQAGDGWERPPAPRETSAATGDEGSASPGGTKIKSAEFRAY